MKQRATKLYNMKPVKYNGETLYPLYVFHKEGQDDVYFVNINVKEFAKEYINYFPDWKRIFDTKVLDIYSDMLFSRDEDAIMEKAYDEILPYFIASDEFIKEVLEKSETRLPVSILVQLNALDLKIEYDEDALEEIEF